MKKSHLIIIAAILTASAGSAGAYYFYGMSDKDVDQEVAVKTPSKPKPKTAGESSSDLQVSSTPSQASSSMDTGQFSVYDQYRDEQSALFSDVVVGEGQEATAGATVAMLYKGWLTNGEMFDQSRLNEQGQLTAFEFTIGSGRVIQGWDQGIAGMKVGGKRRLVIPPSVGDGPAGQGPIPPNATLIFDVELVAIQD